MLYGTCVGVWCRAICTSVMHKCSTQKFVKRLGISLLMWLEVLHCFPLQVGLTANVAKLKCSYIKHTTKRLQYTVQTRGAQIFYTKVYIPSKLLL